MSQSDLHVVELQLNQEEYTRAEFVANLGGAFGIFGDESTEEVIKRIFLSGLAQHDVHALDGEDHADGQQRPTTTHRRYGRARCLTAATPCRRACAEIGRPCLPARRASRSRRSGPGTGARR